LIAAARRKKQWKQLAGPNPWPHGNAPHLTIRKAQAEAAALKKEKRGRQSGEKWKRGFKKKD